jgi:hypothetical protein
MGKTLPHALDKSVSDRQSMQAHVSKAAQRRIPDEKKKEFIKWIGKSTALCKNWLCCGQ